MAPHRKTHHKSRTGCAPCRKRRVKCDEVHPVCSNCSRRDEECIWPNPHRHSALPQVPSPAAPLLTTSQSLTIVSPPPVQPIFSDLTNTIILHHYTVHTCVYGVKTRRIADLRQLLTPKLGFMFPWFLHALLAHGALDLHGLYGGRNVSGGDETDYLAVAKRHAKLSFERTKKPPGSLNPLEAWAVHIRFVLASMQGLFSPTPIILDWKPRILLWIPHCRRLFEEMIEEVVSLRPGVPLQNTLEAMKTGFQRQLSSPPSSATSTLPPGSSPSHSSNADPFPPPEAAPKLHPDLSLLHLPVADTPDPEEVADETTSSIYLDAITKLRVAYSLSFTDGHQVPAMLAWPVMIPAAFLQFMMEKRPRALVVLAHYYVFIYTRVAENAGFRRWPEEDLDRIFRALSSTESDSADRWRTWLARTLSGPDILTVGTASYPSPTSDHASPYAHDSTPQPQHVFVPSHRSSPPLTATSMLNMTMPSSTLHLPPPQLQQPTSQSHHVVPFHPQLLPDQAPVINSGPLQLDTHLTAPGYTQEYFPSPSGNVTPPYHPYSHQPSQCEVPVFDYLHSIPQHIRPSPPHQQQQHDYYPQQDQVTGYDGEWRG